MPLPLDQFAQQLIESGLLAADDVSRIQTEASPTGSEQFARELVRRRILTNFQAQQVYLARLLPVSTAANRMC